MDDKKTRANINVPDFGGSEAPTTPPPLTPPREPQIPLSPFRFWCQKVLPLVYDDSLSYYELLCKVVDFLNKTMEDVSNIDKDMTALYNAFTEYQKQLNMEWEEYQTNLTGAWNQMKEWILNYFNNLDVQDEINKKLDQMAKDGSLSALIQPLFDAYKEQIDTTVNYQNNRISVLEGRMDSFTHLTPGSTTGDAELTDIRVWYNGKSSPTAGDAVRGQVNECLKLVGGINSLNYQEVLPDMDNALPQTMYEMVFATGSTAIPANNPTEKWEGSLNELLTFGVPNSKQRMQYYIVGDTGAMYVRTTGAGYVWKSWVFVQPNLEGYEKFAASINSLNYQTMLPDINNAEPESVYELVFAEGSPSIPAHTPYTPWRGSLAILMTYGDPKTRQRSQYWFNVNLGEIWMRATGTGYVWGKWIKAQAEETINHIYSGDNIVEKMVDYAGTNIYLHGGAYDIISDYMDYLGADYFDNYTGYSSGGNNLGRGLPLYRNTRLTCSPQAEISCNYTGSNPLVKANFCAIALESNVTLDGATITCSGVRDVIHDDFDNNYNGTTIIRNCHIRTPLRSIAGGMSTGGLYIIENNIFDTSSSAQDVTYHNNFLAGSLCRLIIKNNYLRNQLSLRWYGSSELVTKILTTGNSFQKPIETRAENSTATIVNISVVDWNNQIRGN